MIIYSDNEITVEAQENSVPVLKSKIIDEYTIPLKISNSATEVTTEVRLFIDYNHRNKNIVEYSVYYEDFQSVLESTFSKRCPRVDTLDYLLDLSSYTSDYYFNKKFDVKDEPLYSLEEFIANNIRKLFLLSYRLLNNVIHQPIEFQLYKNDEIEKILALPHKIFIYKNSKLYDWETCFNNLNIVKNINDISEPFDVIVHTYALSYGNYEFKKRFNSMVRSDTEDTLKLKIVGYTVEPYYAYDDVKTIFSNMPYLNNFKFIVEIPNIFDEEKLKLFKNTLHSFGKNNLRWRIIKDFVNLFENYIYEKIPKI